MGHEEPEEEVEFTQEQFVEPGEEEEEFTQELEEECEQEELEDDPQECEPDLEEANHEPQQVLKPTAKTLLPASKKAQIRDNRDSPCSKIIEPSSKHQRLVSL